MASRNQATETERPEALATREILAQWWQRHHPDVFAALRDSDNLL
jgi:hypothetical protein